MTSFGSLEQLNGFPHSHAAGGLESYGTRRQNPWREHLFPDRLHREEIRKTARIVRRGKHRYLPELTTSWRRISLSTLSITASVDAGSLEVIGRGRRSLHHSWRPTSVDRSECSASRGAAGRGAVRADLVSRRPDHRLPRSSRALALSEPADLGGYSATVTGGLFQRKSEPQFLTSSSGSWRIIP